MPSRNLARLFKLGATLLLIAGCGDATSTTFSSLSATNNDDSFLFIGQTFGRPTTTTLRYTWKHTSPTAQITTGIEGGAALQGTARIVIRDATATEVYSADLKVNGVDTTATGTAGDWTIDLNFANANGDVVFQALKAPRNLTVANVTTTATGGTPDPDGYTVTLDGTNSQTLGLNGSLIYAVTPGSHTVVISGLAGNCTLTGSNTQTLSVPAAFGATVSYPITCT